MTIWINEVDSLSHLPIKAQKYQNSCQIFEAQFLQIKTLVIEHQHSQHTAYLFDKGKEGISAGNE